MKQLTLKGYICADKFVNDDGSEYPLYFRWNPVKDEVFVRCVFVNEKMLILKYVKVLS
jgi:hypothetical protein